MGRLEDHVLGGSGHPGPRATHDPRERDGSLRIGDHQIFGREHDLLLVEQRELLALFGATHHDPPIGDRHRVEGVQRVSELHEDEVRSVHDVVDGAQAQRLEAARQPVGRGAHANLAHQPRHIGVTRIGGAILHGDRGRHGLTRFDHRTIR